MHDVRAHQRNCQSAQEPLENTDCTIIQMHPQLSAHVWATVALWTRGPRMEPQACGVLSWRCLDVESNACTGHFSVLLASKAVNSIGWISSCATRGLGLACSLFNSRTQAAMV